MLATHIVKNTILLYIRSFISLLITLYTSRLVLGVLGIEDWGIYSVVGGFASMFGVLNSSMAVSIQRFLSVEMTKENGDTKVIFAQSLIIHYFISVVLFLILEIVGCYYIYNIFNVSVDKKNVALLVFQCSSLAMIFTTITVPYMALVISKERMDIFAYIDIANTLLKLAYVSLLFLLPQKLISYACLSFVSVFVTYWAYVFICRKKFIESRNIKYSINRPICISLLSFSGWTTFSSIGGVFRDQLLNLLFNSFLGLTINAAYGISRQLNAAINTFVSNVVIAFNPPITKAYALTEYKSTEKLLIASSKFCSILIMLVFIPMSFEIDFILKIWLVNVPQMTGIITLFMLFSSVFIYMLGNNAIVIRATGHVRKYELSVNLFNFIFIMISYFLLKNNVCLEIVLFILIITTLIQMIYMLRLSSKAIGMKSLHFLYEVVFKMVLSLIIPCLLSYLIWYYTTDFMRFSLIILLNTISFLVSSYFIYLNNNERIIVNTLITKIRKKINI